MIKSYCNKCGNELLPGASFCMKCGSKITPREPLSSTSSDNEDGQNEDEIIADKMYERDSYDRSNTDTGYDDICENRVIHREIDDNVPKNESKYAGDNAIVAWFLNLDFFL